MPHQLPPDSISLADRWRLVLAVTEAQSPKACAAATCLDQLYGYGRGEGAGDRLARPRAASQRGGTEAPQPTTIEWVDDLEKLFGSDVCQEVLGEAVGAGRAAAAELLDAAQVQPSLLRTGLHGCCRLSPSGAVGVSPAGLGVRDVPLLIDVCSVYCNGCAAPGTEPGVMV